MRYMRVTSNVKNVRDNCGNIRTSIIEIAISFSPVVGKKLTMNLETAYLDFAKTL